MELFREFVDVVFDGIQTRAAEALKVDKSLVSRLYRGERVSVSPELANRIQEVSGGRYRREAFLWPDASPALPQEAQHGPAPESEAA